MRRIILTLSVLAAVGLAPAPSSASMAVDWADHLAARVELPGGWRLEGCEGLDLTLCAYDADGVLSGTVILVVLDLWAHEDVSLAGVAAHVADFHEVFEQDRLQTCGADFAYEADELVETTVGGQPGYRYGFRLYDAAGNLHEQAVIHFTFASGLRLVLNTSFVDPQGCPGPDPERDEFAVAHIPAIAPHLDQLAAQSILPTDLTSGPACTPGAAPANGFVDVVGNVHARSIDCLAWHGVLAGTAADRYSPAAPVTRGQLASMLARLLEAAQEELPEPADQGFADIAGSVHADRINQLAAAGVVLGTTATTFEPGRPVTRAQAAALAVRVHELGQSRELYDAGIAFDDVHGVHAPAISRAATAGLAHGRSDGLFAPHEPVRRDQVASLLVRTLNRLSWFRWVPLPSDGTDSPQGPEEPRG